MFSNRDQEKGAWGNGSCPLFLIMSDYRLYRLYNDTKNKSNPLNVLIFDWDDSQDNYVDLGLLIKPHASEILGTIVSTPTDLFTGEKG